VLTHGFVVDAKGKKMSKSEGNVIPPEKVIKQYGAEILRLWVSATDYRDDIRISPDILKQLTDAYKKIRNTCKFLLSNLYDFDPLTDTVAYAHMQDIDKYALIRLGELIAKARTAFESYEFHTIYHGLYNYCTLDLSAFYLDILKDRLYTSPPRSDERRSAQTAIHTILDAVVRLMAPIFVFTSEEIWRYLPDVSTKRESVHLMPLPVVNPEWQNPQLAAKWSQVLNVRAEVTQALEKARTAKLIGHPLDASVTISAPSELYDELREYADELRSVFIVSKVTLVQEQTLEDAYKSAEIEGLQIHIQAAPGVKCERCWIYDSSVGADSEHPTICKRCTDVLAVIS
jgi:isoleucyl-tRNA synthetase